MIALNMNRTLQSESILPNVKMLHNRIKERFPERNLSRIGNELYIAAFEAQEQARLISKPNILLRVGIFILVSLIIILSISALFNVDISIQDFGFMDLVTLFESLINDLIFVGAGIFFLVSIENRIKRKQTLEKLNELRVMAHIIDMHQLTKEPETVLRRGLDTKSSPERNLSMFELSRFLDYCSEMLSLIGKSSVIYVQNFDDQVALATVNEIEALTSGLSRKIWQKIMIIHQLEESRRIDEIPKNIVCELPPNNSLICLNLFRFK